MRKDEENERTIRAYSKAGTFEYVPRSKSEDDYVVARPMKAPRCAACGSPEPGLHECEFCHEYYCEAHLPQEKHGCPGPAGEAPAAGDLAAMKRAIAAKMEDLVARLPAVYLLIDSAGPEELKAFLESLEKMGDVLTRIAGREEDRDMAPENLK